MLSFDRCTRCTRKAASWFGVPWEKVCEMSREEKHKGEFEAAEATLSKLDKNEDPGFKVPMSVSAHKRTGYRVESVYSFVTNSQFIRRFGSSPKALGMKLIKLSSEDGSSELKGVVVKYAPREAEFRRVVFFRNGVDGR